MYASADVGALQAQLQSAQSQSTEVQRREVQAAQEAMVQQVRTMEATWRAQLEASTKSLMETRLERERMAAQAATGATQVCIPSE